MYELLSSNDDIDEETLTADFVNAHRKLKKNASKLYLSHFLSTFNSRIFEFGSVLYLAAVFPGTLLPLSVYAVVRGASAILLSSAIGKHIDTENRLSVVRLSIVLQRVSVATSCAIFFLLETQSVSSPTLKVCSMVILSALACIEKAGSIMNLVSVEKDWVVKMTEDDSEFLPVMNSRMRQIDLICKLLGPFGIALLDSASTRIAILVNFGLNVASVPAEYILIAQVYLSVPLLKQGKSQPEEAVTCGSSDGADRLAQYISEVAIYISSLRRDMVVYFTNKVFLASFAGALLYFTVLSFSGQMITYLLATGYNSTQVAVARTISVCFEISATIVAPWLMQRIGPVRAGFWFLSWQSGCLLVGIAASWLFPGDSALSASGIVGGTILSRLGLWGFDLCVQIILQDGVEEAIRGAFSTTEASWQNVFELLSYVSTIIFSKPGQFRYPASASGLAACLALIMYSCFAFPQRQAAA